MAVERGRVIDENVDLAGLRNHARNAREVLQVEADPANLRRQVAGGEILVEREDAPAGAVKELRGGETDAAPGPGHQHRLHAARPGMEKALLFNSVTNSRS